MKANSIRLARVMALISLIGAILLPLLAAAIWLFWDRFAPLAAGNLDHIYDLEAGGPAVRLAGFAVSMTGALIQGYGLLGLRDTFREGAAGRPLSSRAVGGFRRFAWISLVMAVYGVFSRTALIALFSAADPAQPGALSIQVGTPEIKAVFMAIMLVFVSEVFAEGKRARDENEAFV